MLGQLTSPPNCEYFWTLHARARKRCKQTTQTWPTRTFATSLLIINVFHLRPARVKNTNLSFAKCKTISRNIVNCSQRRIFSFLRVIIPAQVKMKTAFNTVWSALYNAPLTIWYLFIIHLQRNWEMWRWKSSWMDKQRSACRWHNHFCKQWGKSAVASPKSIAG